MTSCIHTHLYLPTLSPPRGHLCTRMHTHTLSWIQAHTHHSSFSPQHTICRHIAIANCHPALSLVHTMYNGSHSHNHTYR